MVLSWLYDGISMGFVIQFFAMLERIGDLNFWLGFNGVARFSVPVYKMKNFRIVLEYWSGILVFAAAFE